jgi:hypothetical protein
MPTIIDGTVGITFPNSTVQASAGQVLQVVNVAYDTFTSTSSSTYADTGLTASITPLFSSSRILVMVHQNGVGKANNQQVSIQLLRNSTTISKLGEDDGNTGTTTTNYFGSVSTCRFDSPATTSATTYKTQFRTPSAGSAAYVQLGQAVSTITLMEIAT